MRQFLLSLCVLLLVCCSCSGTPRRVAPPPVVSGIADATALLVGREDGAVSAICSAVWVGEVDLLTAAHCAKGLAVEQREDPVGGEIEFARRVDMAGKEIDSVETDRAIVVAIDEVNDLALLSARRRVHGVAHLYRGPIEQGDAVLTLGHTLGLPWSLSGGVIGADRHMRWRDNPVHVLQVVGGASFGDSGGGVWTVDGELLGIASFRRAEAPLLFYTHRDVVLEFLQRECVL